MNTLLLLLTASPLIKTRPDSVVIWCPPFADGMTCSEHVRRLTLPGDAVAPLCRALYAAELHPWDGALIVSTASQLPEALLSAHLPSVTTAYLTGPDEGALFFPSADIFCQCARDAIRTHNPETGHITLDAVWHQTLLAEPENAA